MHFQARRVPILAIIELWLICGEYLEVSAVCGAEIVRMEEGICNALYSGC